MGLTSPVGHLELVHVVYHVFISAQDSAFDVMIKVVERVEVIEDHSCNFQCHTASFCIATGVTSIVFVIVSYSMPECSCNSFNLARQYNQNYSFPR